MSADEEYLEGLLDSPEEGDEEAESLPLEEGTAETTEFNEEMLPEDLGEDIFSEDEPEEEQQEETDEPLEGAEALDAADAAEESGNEEDNSDGIADIQKEDDFSLEDFAMDESAFDDIAISDFPVDEAEPEKADFAEDMESISPDDVDAMFAAAHAAASGMDAAPEEQNQDDDIFNFFGDMPEEEEESGSPESSADKDNQEGLEPDGGKKKKAKKEKKSLFGKKKKKDPAAEEGAESGDAGTEEASSEGEEESKPKGFFSRLITFLTEADDDETDENQAAGLEPSDENKNILKELEDEDKKKKKKKVKGKKAGEEGEEGAEGEEKSKKKKKKKEKEKKESTEGTEPAESVPKGKKISIKSIALVTGFSLTVAAMIMVICSIIPAFFEKRAARNAFYDADYTKSFELLYGKKLDESDEMIYNKSKTILEMRRKLDSYHNYLGIGKEVQALDALMSGVEKYPENLAKAEEYRVVQDVNAIYGSILSILSDKYNIDEALAQTIIAYDDVTYTKKLESIVYNTPFTVSQERDTAPAAADILPEEPLVEEEIPAEADAMAENTGVPEQMEDGNVQEEFPEGMGESISQEDVSQQEQSGEQISFQEPETVQQDGGSSLGEDVSTWTGNSSYGSQGEQIQGIRQPIGIEIHGN